MISAILDIFNIDIGTWLILFLIAWYLFRGARAGKQVGSVLGQIVIYTVLILVSFGAASMLGYADLNIGSFVSDAGHALVWGMRNAVPIARDVVFGVIVP